jgi:TPR repeat protein
MFAPWIQEKLQARSRSGEQTVFASSHTPAGTSQIPPPVISVDTANFAQLQELAKRGDSAAENAIGILYAQGNKQGIPQDEIQAAHWFTKAAEDGSLPAQYKLGLLYWGGHGVPRDANKAYFWAVLARAGGQEGSKDLAKVLANGMTRAQAAAIEQQAEIWYLQHQAPAKPNAGR